MEFQSYDRLFEVDPLTSYRDELTYWNKRPSQVESQLINDTHDFILSYDEPSIDTRTDVPDNCDDFANYRTAAQEASPVDNTS